jgi:hypothetical protein
LFICSSNSTSFVEKEDGVHLNDKSFPWELVIDRGKILGCIYENQFYSLGSILILESLPRKCGLATDRNGVWEQLSESELLLFKETIETEQELERDSTYIAGKPINKAEARLIRYLRSVKKVADKESN